MPLQPPNFFGLLDTTNPAGSDTRTISDDYHRMIQQSCQNQGPNWTDVINATHQDLNLTTGIAAAGAKLLTGNANVTIAYRYQNTADTGWVIEEPDANVRELVIGPAASGGTVGGSLNPNSMQGSVSISISVSGRTGFTEIEHTHGTGDIRDSPPTQVIPGVLGGGSLVVAGSNHTHEPHSGPTGPATGQTNHDHSFSDSGSGGDTFTLSPRYARGILQKLEA